MQLDRKYFYEYLWLFAEVAGNVLAFSLLAFLIYISVDFWLVQLLRFLLILFVVLFLPGYYFSLMMFAKRDIIDMQERIGLGLGISVAILSIGIVILDSTIWMLTVWPIYWMYAILIGLFLLVSIIRRARNIQQAEMAIALIEVPYQNIKASAVKEKIILGLFLGVMVVILMILTSLFVLPTNQPVTNLYFVNFENFDEQNLNLIKAGTVITTPIGIQSQESQTLTYWVEVKETGNGMEGEDKLIGYIEPFDLSPGQAYETVIQWQPTEPGFDREIVFFLYRADDPEPYRRLVLWVNVAE
jgi:uncharacterized membrane protein